MAVIVWVKLKELKIYSGKDCLISSAILSFSMGKYNHKMSSKGPLEIVTSYLQYQPSPKDNKESKPSSVFRKEPKMASIKFF